MVYYVHLKFKIYENYSESEFSNSWWNGESECRINPINKTNYKKKSTIGFNDVLKIVQIYGSTYVQIFNNIFAKISLDNSNVYFYTSVYSD